MKKLPLLLLLLAATITGKPQKLHSPAEIMQIMTDSKVSYQVDIFNGHTDCPDRSDRVNYHNSYRTGSDTDLVIRRFAPNEQAKPLFDKAEEDFQSNRPGSAGVNYRLALAADSSLSLIFTYLGEISEHAGDHAAAIQWYRKAIARNYIDYMAHWFLADNLLEMKETDEAVSEIVIAHILNRNNPRLKISMERIFAKAKIHYGDWCFVPQMELNELEDGKVRIAFNDKWTGYAIAKGVWTYEPGYRQSMGVGENEPSMVEERECLLALLVGLDNSKAKLKKEPALLCLKKALENDQFDTYILYEILLPQYPSVAFQLPEKAILGIRDYVLNLRSKF